MRKLQTVCNKPYLIIEEYGFEGVDIDFEGGAVSDRYIAEALRTVRNHFGEDFIITMAPETYYSRIQILTEQWLHLHITD